MKKIFVYDTYNGTFEVFYLENNAIMPYVADAYLTAYQFAPTSDIAWTTKQAMQAYSKTKHINPTVQVQSAFHRTSERTWINASTHVAGVGFSLVCAPSMTYETLYRLLSRDDIWNTISDVEHTINYLHVDMAYLPPASEYTRYPLLRPGDSNTYVLTLQDALLTLGYLKEDRLTGIYDEITEEMVKKLQGNSGVSADGMVGAVTWDIIVMEINKLLL